MMLYLKYIIPLMWNKTSYLRNGTDGRVMVKSMLSVANKVFETC
jgi:hypothetical protein